MEKSKAFFFFFFFNKNEKLEAAQGSGRGHMVYL